MTSSLRRLDSATLLGPRVEQDELLDGGRFDPAELDGNLRDIRTVNRLAGGQAVVLAHLPELTARIERGRPIEVLDLATGSAIFPRPSPTGPLTMRAQCG